MEPIEKDKYLTLLSKAVDCSINAIGITDLESKLIYVNESAVKLWRFNNKQEMLGRFLPEFWEGERIRHTIEELHCKGFSAGQDLAKRKDNSVFNVEYSANLIRDENGDPLAMFAAFVDITKRKTALKLSKKKQQELETKSRELEEVNSALRVLLKKREEDKAELEESVLSNVKNNIEPYLEKLLRSSLNQRQRNYIEIVQKNLNDITSPFARNLSSIYYHLTPQEIQIANLVKQGKTNKEIAAVMSLSLKTIEFHRTNIRKKLGLKTRKANLRTYLMAHG